MSAVGFWAIAAAIGISYIVSAVKAATERRSVRTKNVRTREKGQA